MTENISENSTLSSPSPFVDTFKPSAQATGFSQQSYQHYAQSYKSMQYFKRPLTITNEYYLKKIHNNAPSEKPNLVNHSSWDLVSQQIWEKFTIFQQSNATYSEKINVWCELYELMKKFPLFQLSNWSLHLVGSSITGFGLDSSDIDICLAMKTVVSHIDPRAEAVATLNEIRKFLMDTENSFKDFYLINAKVPILRFVHQSRDTTSKFLL
jgi:DNA polymerase sigma